MIEQTPDGGPTGKAMRTAVIGVIATAALGLISTACAAPKATAPDTTSRTAAVVTSHAAVTAGLPAVASGAPAGWAPVPYQRAQLSVPGRWLVESPAQFSCFPRAPGMIFAGSKPGFPKRTGCRLTASLAWITSAGRTPPGVGHGKPAAVIHGIPVYRLASSRDAVQYIAPELGVRVGARGPLARRVLATLTWSPLSVVLRRGPAAPVPAGLTWRSFGGVRFLTPRAWQVRHESQWATCGTGQAQGSLELIDATKPAEALPCPFPFPTAANEEALPGLTVVTGKDAAQSVSQDFGRCRLRRGARICLASITGQGGSYSGVLIFSVSRPHARESTYFLLGLPGNGLGARAIFDSIEIAS
jgi:hypothetical protein